MTDFMPYLLVGMGGFVGANARYLVARGLGGAFDTSFPRGSNRY
jgi:fluoride ion exporter CrcB/FEX